MTENIWAELDLDRWTWEVPRDTPGPYVAKHIPKPLITDWVKKWKPIINKALEKAERFDNYLESIKDSIPHVSLADYEVLEDKLEAIKNYLKEEKMVIYDSYNRYSAQIITHTKGMLLLSKLLEILEDEDLQSIGDTA